jgi:hypothetical protein
LFCQVFDCIRMPTSWHCYHVFITISSMFIHFTFLRAFWRSKELFTICFFKHLFQHRFFTRISRLTISCFLLSIYSSFPMRVCPLKGLLSTFQIKNIVSIWSLCTKPCTNGFSSCFYQQSIFIYTSCLLQPMHMNI